MNSSDLTSPGKERFFRLGSRLVKRRRTFSMLTISFFNTGDHITELYSKIGLTYISNALTSNLRPRDTKQRKITQIPCRVDNFFYI